MFHHDCTYPFQFLPKDIILEISEYLNYQETISLLECYASVIDDTFLKMIKLRNNSFIPRDYPAIWELIKKYEKSWNDNYPNDPLDVYLLGEQLRVTDESEHVHYRRERREKGYYETYFKYWDDYTNKIGRACQLGVSELIKIFYQDLNKCVGWSKLDFQEIIKYVYKDWNSPNYSHILSHKKVLSLIIMKMPKLLHLVLEYSVIYNNQEIFDLYISRISESKTNFWNLFKLTMTYDRVEMARVIIPNLYDSNENQRLEYSKNVNNKIVNLLLHLKKINKEIFSMIINRLADIDIQRIEEHMKTL